jgi:hypothetical protein
MHRLAPQPGAFFLAHFWTFRRTCGHETIYALKFDWIFIELFLLFSRHDVAKEFEILRKWTKKMSKTRTRRNTFGKIRRGYIINGPKGLKDRRPAALRFDM